MRIWDFTDYKEIIRVRTRELAQTRKSVSLKRLAATVPMQYTYLSRVLNRDDTHLTEDQLHSICQQLDFFSDEFDYVFALRSLEVTRHSGRREFLKRRIEQLKRAKDLSAPVEKGSAGGGSGGVGAGEAGFLLSPLAWLTYFSLGIQSFRENPKKIAHVLAIPEAKLAEILRSLSEQSLIETDGSPWKIGKVLKNHFHYSPSHPLTRIHQQLLKDFANQHLLKVPEDLRVIFTATFNADTAAFESIQRKFKEFISEVEKLAVKAPSRQTFQLNVDLFPWN